MNYHNKSKQELITEISSTKKQLKKLQDASVESNKLLKELEGRYHMLVDNNPAAIAVHSEGKIRYINSRGIELLGATNASQIIGQSVLKFLHPSSLKFVKKRITQIMQNPDYGKLAVEEKYVRVDGQVIDLEVSAFPINYYGKKSILVVLIDITERKKAEEELHKLSRSVRQSPNIVVITNKDGNIEYVNPKFTEVTGYSHDEVIGKNPRILKSGYSKNEYYSELWKNISSGKEWRGEFQNIKKNGELYWESAYISAIRNRENEITHFVAVKEDITEKRKAESEIRKLSQVVETSSQGVVIANTDTIIVYVNKGMLKMLNYDHQDEILGRSMLEFTNEDGIRVINDKIIPSLLEKGNWKGEIFNKRKDGTFFPCDDNCSIIKGKDGKIEYFVATFVDISDRKKREVALSKAIAATKKSEKKYRELFESVEEGIISVNENEEITLVNNAGSKIFGCKIDELTGKSLKDFMDEEKYDKILSQTSNRINKNANKYEVKIILSNQLRKTISVSANPIFKNGKYKGALGIVSDITEKKNIEKDLIDAKEKAEESDKLKSAFLATISHELRTPLNAILGFSQLIYENKNIKKETKDFANAIQSSGIHLLSIIEDILDISVIESGKLKTQISEVNINQLFEMILMLLQNEIELTNKKHLKIYYKQSDLINNPIIKTDLSRLKQILINLLKNAIKFTDSGSIEYGVSFPDNKETLFYIKDTGIGIPKDQHKLIFDHFRQVENSHTRKHGGTGLGLSISKKLVELFDGKLWFESEEGKGSTFYFSLPILPINDHISQEIIHQSIDVDWTGKTILVAEDENISYQLISMFLKPSGVNILHAKNGQEAVDLYQSHPEIDLVLMDIRMPILNGIEATKALKKINNQLPIIAQTAYAMIDEKNKIIASGVNDYLTKPLKQHKLINSISKYF